MMPLHQADKYILTIIFLAGKLTGDSVVAQISGVTFILVRKDISPVNFTAGVDITTLMGKLEPTFPVKFIIHGWLGDSTSDVITRIANAYLWKGGVNIVKVDWSVYANRMPYTAAALSTDRAAVSVAAVMNKLIATNMIQPNGIHLIGFSLGAHVAGTAGSLTSPKIARITGLDPAGPGYETTLINAISGNLDKSDALFVDVIHTCAGYAGVSQPAGHLDFYPNGGTPWQPGCEYTFTPLTCSHEKSYQYYAESIYNPTAFPSVKCVNSNCSVYKIAYMGNSAALPANPLNYGSYYLRTNPNSPFGQG